jgi:hypothetical protein
MGPAFTQMPCRHHRPRGGLDRTTRVGQKARHTCQGLVGLGIEDMQDRADQKTVAGFLPMRPALEGALGIDQHVGDILNVPHFPDTAANLEQRIVGG